MPPSTQHKYLERIDSLYVLTNGTYTVQATLPMPVSKYVDGKFVPFGEIKEIKSSGVPIKIDGVQR